MHHPSIHPSNKNGLEWSSWLAPLLACYGASPNLNIVEVGMGHFSTPALHNLAIASGGTMVSLESSQEWADGFKGYGDSHLVLKGPYRGTIAAARAYAAASGRFAVGLIDQSPPLGPDGKETSCGEARLESFLLLQDVCDYLVVHDFWHGVSSSIMPYTLNMNWKVCSDYEPPTLVASKELEIPKVLL